MLAESIEQLESCSLQRIRAAVSPEELEAVRVEVLGRKGALTLAGREMGKLPPEERASAGKLLNGARQALEQELETRKRQFDEAALRARLDSEWLDLQLP